MKAAILLFLLVLSSQRRSPAVPPEGSVTFWSRMEEGLRPQQGEGRGRLALPPLIYCWCQPTHFIKILVEISNWRHDPLCVLGKSGKPRNVEDMEAQSQRGAAGQGGRKGKRWPRQKIPQSSHYLSPLLIYSCDREEGRGANISCIGQFFSSILLTITPSFLALCPSPLGGVWL